MPSLTTAQIAALCGGDLDGDEQKLICGANTLDRASGDDIAFVANHKAASAASHSRAGCLLVPKDFNRTGPWSIIRVAEPRSAFSKVLNALYKKAELSPSIHPTAIVAASAQVNEECVIGAYVTVGERTVIERHCRIGNGCILGDDVHVAEATILHANVTIYDQVRVGARVILHAGCVLGADGFGFTLIEGRYEKFPQVGTIV